MFVLWRRSMYRAIRACCLADRSATAGREILVDLLPQLAMERPLKLNRLQGEFDFWYWLSMKIWSFSAVVSFGLEAAAWRVWNSSRLKDREATSPIIAKIMTIFIFLFGWFIVVYKTRIWLLVQVGGDFVLKSRLYILQQTQNPL